YRYRVAVPPDITVLAKAILNTKAVIVLLEPNFSIMKAVEPFAENIMKERFHPKRLLRRALERSFHDFETLRELPKDIQDTTKTIQKGRLKFNLNVEDAPSFLQRLDRISN